MTEPRVGDLRVYWVPQVPMNAYYVLVGSVQEAVKIMDVLADYCNAGGLEEWSAGDPGHQEPGWYTWYSDDGLYDDLREYLKENA